MIEVRDIWKSFKSIDVLEGVGFQARDGEITGLIGPNGAGKTTTLRVLYTVIHPDRGTALIDGYDSVRQKQQVQRSIGVLPDNRGLYPRLTAREHVRYYGKLHGMRGPDLEDRINELCRYLGMDDIIDRRTKGFSKGQTMKVALARALVHGPQNVMLDEPTNGLDIAASRAVRNLIREMRDEGRCILFSSHIMQEVEALCDRIVVIDQGHIVADGTPDELRAATGQESLEEVFMSTVNKGGDTAGKLEEAAQ
jgi:sodium transport system ATP-binding protein